MVKFGVDERNGRGVTLGAEVGKQCWQTSGSFSIQSGKRTLEKFIPLKLSVFRMPSEVFVCLPGDMGTAILGCLYCKFLYFSYSASNLSFLSLLIHFFPQAF